MYNFKSNSGQQSKYFPRKNKQLNSSLSSSQTPFFNHIFGAKFAPPYFTGMPSNDLRKTMEREIILAPVWYLLNTLRHSSQKIIMTVCILSCMKELIVPLTSHY